MRREAGGMSVIASYKMKINHSDIIILYRQKMNGKKSLAVFKKKLADYRYI